MISKSIELIKPYLTLFGLTEAFSFEELNRSYRTIAKLNHPDLNRDADAESKMVYINEGYRLLKDFQKEHGSISAEGPALNHKEKVEDIYYKQYKKGFQILQNAFDRYFGEVEDKSDEGRLNILKERLNSAKREFSRLVTELPYNQWVDDAIDKISSINKWLAE